MNNRPAVRSLAAALLTCLLVGCAGGPERAETQAAPESPPASTVEPREAVSLFRGDGRRASWAEFVAETGNADVVFVGETHGHPLGLAAAAALWEDILAARPGAALLMEFFERDTQVAIDDYLAGLTETDGFREASNRTPGNYPPGHERMIESARAAGATVIAANAPRRYVRVARSEGYDRLLSLSPDQRALFRVPERPLEGRYRDEFFSLMAGMGGHGDPAAGTEDAVAAMFRSQTLWDSTMGESVARAANAGARPALLVTGRFHTDFEGGTVQMFRRHRPDLTVRTVSVVASDGEALASEDEGRADFVLYVGE